MQKALSEPAPVVKSREVNNYLARHRLELLALLEQEPSSGVEFARRHSKLMDGLVSTIFQAAHAALPAPSRVSVVLGAVGGYGRGQLGWKSDLDVRLITNGAPESVQPLAEALLYPLWDAGVSIGHQVSTVTDLIEAARHDLPTATSVLDFRPLAGDAELGQWLEERAFAGVFSEAELPAFLHRLDEEVIERHKRFGDSVYLLEPDVKNGAGGLRDLDISLWAARARFRTAGIADLKTLGVLSAREATDLAAAKDFLWKLRNHLHLHANRRSDRLTFEEQESLAEFLGYRAKLTTTPADEAEASGMMVEAFMSDYYRHARIVLRLRDQIVSRAMPAVGRTRPTILELGGGLQSFNGQLTFSKVASLESDPALAFRLYAEAVERGVTVLPYARDVVIRATSTPSFCEALRKSAEAARLFVRLVSDPQQSAFRNGSILAELHEVGLLIAMIPEFLPVVGRVHHDVYHVYTVDVHSVAAVDRLRALARGDFAGEQALASELAAEATRPALLYLAILLHDVGKAIGGRDHSRRGAEMARPILARLGLADADIDDACHLIFQHLVMYKLAARRNPEDRRTISEFAEQVRGREGLRHLYLLTFADLSTTSPTAMTKWKSHMLDELFLVTDQLLAGSPASDASRLSAIKAAVREHWEARDDIGFLSEYLDSMPEGYLLSNGPAEIASHALVAFSGRGAIVTAAMLPSRRAEVAELCVVTGDRSRDPLFVITQDRPGLLSSISAAIAANGFDVHAAQIHSRRLSDGTLQAVDLFWVTDRLQDPEGFEYALKKLQKDLSRVISGAIAPEDLLKTRHTGRFSERPVPAVATQIILDNRASESHTLVEVVTRDRPGLLFALARTFYSLDLTIGVAKINTEGTRAIDVFYVTELDGKKVEGPTRTDQVRGALSTMLNASPAK